MSCNCNEISTCEGKQYSNCVYYELAVPIFSNLFGDQCYTVEEVLADMYLLLGGIKNEIDLTELLTNGINYPLVQGQLTVKNALKTHAELLLSLQESLSKLENGTHEIFNISNWGLDFSCIADNCGTPPVYLKDLIQLLITKVCSTTP